MRSQIIVLVLALCAGTITLGCHGAKTEPAKVTAPEAAGEPKAGVDKKGEEHAHKPGAHGGILVEIGRDNYHAEAVFEKGGLLRLYTLGKDEAKVQEVESQTLTAYAKPEEGSESTPFTLPAVPQAGDAEGTTSQFVGRLPADLAGRKLEVTIPSIKIAGERFRLGFRSAGEAHEEAMPAKVENQEERQLYLTPGGKYTEADIKANGGVTASEKFKGAMASHDLKPKRGDKLCPITLTKANPKFAWTVGGKVYEFCCPPCVDEFVKTAKEQPEEIKEPQAYLKQ
jgi:hypothetical protein